MENKPPIHGLESISPPAVAGKAASSPALVDANEEKRAYEEGTYYSQTFDGSEKDDDKLRAEFKKIIHKHMAWITGPLVGLVAASAILFAFLLGKVLFDVLQSKKESGEALSYVVSHTFVLILGASSKFLFPYKKKE